MKRKIAGLVLFCLILFAAILAGYWDMLSAEKLKIVRDKASNAVGEIADIVRKEPGPAPAPTGTAAAPVADGTPAADATSRPSSKPAASESAGAEDAEPSTTPAPTPAAAPSSETAAAAPAASPGAAEPVGDAPAPPTFDILRVEPDGSTVLAGRAPAGSTVSLLDGTTAIGSETANAAGEFVVVLDERLAVGDHQIKIEARLPDGRSVASAETAIVSIPEAGREVDLLAMVEAPDAASRLISIPAAKPDASGAGAGQDEAIAALPPGETQPGELLLPQTQKPGAAEGSPPAAADGAPPGAAAPAFSAPAAPAAKARATLLVEAVEIENDTVYVAGRATGGASVRVYIDNAFLAEDKRPAGDRFLVSARAPIATGDHIVRADALDAAGAVLARVEVPFFKPEGEAMAAVSPNEGAPGAAQGAAPAAEESAAAAAAPAAAPSPASAEAATPGEAPSSDVAATPSEDALADRMAAAEPSVTPAASDPAISAPASGQAPAPADPTSAAGAAPAEATPAIGAGPSTPSQDASVDADRFGPAESASGEPGADIAVTRQPALEGARSRVIIRRGDTLWRISRETYGLGRRYTVIYLANGDQIRDPDRIYPGQVFRMPKDDAADAGAPRVQ